jgi:hypothetical protein
LAAVWMMYQELSLANDANSREAPRMTRQVQRILLRVQLLLIASRHFAALRGTSRDSRDSRSQCVGLSSTSSLERDHRFAISVTDRCLIRSRSRHSHSLLSTSTHRSPNSTLRTPALRFLDSSRGDLMPLCSPFAAIVLHHANQERAARAHLHRRSHRSRRVRSRRTCGARRSIGG